MPKHNRRLRVETDADEIRVVVGKVDPLDILCMTNAQLRQIQPNLTEHVMRGIRAACDSPFRGGFVTVRWILQWLEAHPNFRAHHFRMARAAENSAQRKSGDFDEDV